MLETSCGIFNSTVQELQQDKISVYRTIVCAYLWRISDGPVSIRVGRFYVQLYYSIRVVDRSNNKMTSTLSWL